MGKIKAADRKGTANPHIAIKNPDMARLMVVPACSPIINNAISVP